jgi:lysine 2,3-aminomutase
MKTKREMWNDLTGSQVTEKDWNNWIWQMQKRVDSIDELKKIIPLSPEEQQKISLVLKHFRMAVPPYFLIHVRNLIDKGEEANASALKKIFLPDTPEILPEISPTSEMKTTDGMGEDASTPFKFISQLYPDRILLFVTNECPIRCRYCFRRRKVIPKVPREDKKDQKIETLLEGENLEKAIKYIKEEVRNGTKIRDVILSGGDPLSLGDEKLDKILTALRSVKNVEILRIDSIFPVVLPQRITDSLVKILKKHHPLFMTLHFIHPAEITEEVKEACAKLVDAGIPLGTYTPILKGISDDREILKTLLFELVKMRIRPYYLVQFIPTKWTEHFRVPLLDSLKLIDGIYGYISGLAVPHFHVYVKRKEDLRGEGKVILLPLDIYRGRTKEGHLLKTYRGEIGFYEEPETKEM